MVFRFKSAPFLAALLLAGGGLCGACSQFDRGRALAIETLRDPRHRAAPDALTPADLAAFTRRSENVPNFGFSGDTIWIRFFVPADQDELLLELAYPPLDEVVLFEPLADGTYRALATGDRTVFDTRAVAHRNFVFRVHATRAPYYLKLRSESALLAPLRLFTPAEFARKNRIEQWLLGGFYGALLIMSLYNAFLYLMLRDESYLFYVCSTAFSWVYFLVWNGLAFEFLWPNLPDWNNQANPLFQGLGTIFLFLFFRSFLKGSLPRWADRFFLFLTAPAALLVCLALADLYTAAILLGFAVTAVGLGLGVPIGLYLLWRGRHQVRFLMVAWSFLLGAMILNALRAYQIIPANFFAQLYGIQLGTALELTLLSLALADRFRLMEREREEARQSSAAKTAFLANMSHEIRTPLHAILGMTEMLADEDDDERRRNYLSVLRNAGQNLLSIINDVLDISRIESGKLELDPADFAPEAVLDETVDLILPEARAKGLNVALFFDPRLPRVVHGDPGRLRQVLINLVANAVKFTHAGEIYLEARRDPDDGDRIAFLVRDTGIGIDQQKWEEIFEAFTQADETTTRRYGGTGLGLTICRRLVDLMGGRIGVESHPGQGSRFYFSIPLPAAGADEEPELPDLRGQSARLVVAPGTDRLILREYLHATGLHLIESTAAFDRADAAGEAACDFVFLTESESEQDALLPELQRKQPAARIVVLSRAIDFVYSGNPARLPLPIRRSALFRLLSAPAAAAPGIAGVSSGSESVAQLRPLRILLAEDNDDNRLLFTAFLKRTPHRVVVAENGRVALERFEEEPFDIVFMDIQMPVMDGLTATGRIRAFEAGALRAGRRQRRTPVYALTANVLKGEIDRCLQAGCDGHIGKPVSKSLLLEIIARHAGG